MWYNTDLITSFCEFTIFNNEHSSVVKEIHVKYFCRAQLDLEEVYILIFFTLNEPYIRKNRSVSLLCVFLSFCLFNVDAIVSKRNKISTLSLEFRSCNSFQYLPSVSDELEYLPHFRHFKIRDVIYTVVACPAKLDP